MNKNVFLSTVGLTFILSGAISNATKQNKDTTNNNVINLLDSCNQLETQSIDEEIALIQMKDDLFDLKNYFVPQAQKKLDYLIEKNINNLENKSPQERQEIVEYLVENHLNEHEKNDLFLGLKENMNKMNKYIQEQETYVNNINSTYNKECEINKDG